jgi:hypothetical protein
VNTSNVVLKAAAMPEWRKLFEVKDSDFGCGAWIADPKPTEAAAISPDVGECIGDLASTRIGEEFVRRDASSRGDG